MPLGYITLFTDNPKASAEWYCYHFGCETIVTSDDFILLDCGGGSNIGLHRGEGLAQPERVQLHFEVPDIDITYEHLSREGLQFSQAPRNMPWGYRSASTTDPAGHCVEIYTSQLGNDKYGA